MPPPTQHPHTQLDHETVSLLSAVVTLCQSALSADLPHTPPELADTLQILHGMVQLWDGFVDITHIIILSYNVHNMYLIVSCSYSLTNLRGCLNVKPSIKHLMMIRLIDHQIVKYQQRIHKHSYRGTLQLTSLYIHTLTHTCINIILCSTFTHI